MMELHILRHAIAVERDAPGQKSDRDRPLTSEGRKKLRAIARAFRVMEPELDLILSSPYVRARQTAELVAEALHAGQHLKFSAHLEPDGDPEQLIEQLGGLHGRPHRVLLVGHEPYLSQLISTLLTGGPDLSLTMKKGGLCKLTLHRLVYGRCATLEWLLTPRLTAGLIQ